MEYITKLKEWKFDDVAIGQVAGPMEIIFSEDLVRNFIKLSSDLNPLHVDDEYARSKGFEGRIVHGALLFAKASYFIGMEIPGKGGIFCAAQELKFHNPVYMNERCLARGIVTHKTNSTKTIEMKIEIYKTGVDNLKSKIALSGIVLAKML